MDLNKEIWELIESRPKIVTTEQKQALHVDIMRLIEKSKTTVGKKLGVTIMTAEGSKAGDRVNQIPGHRGSPGEAKPKTL